MASTKSSGADLARLVERCRREQAIWGQLGVRRRLPAVRRFRRLLVEAQAELTAAVQKDIGKPATETLGAEILPLADACRFLQARAPGILRSATVSWNLRPLWLWDTRNAIHRRPRGVVGIIGTWNYPLLLNGVQIVQALTAGNGVVWKPSEVAPGSAAVLHDLLLRAGYPADLVQRLPATREAGSELAEAAIDHVVFTGTAATGQKLARRLGERLIPSTLELSGCDALFVLPDADLDLAARAIWFGATLNRGQTCLAVKRVFAHRSLCASLEERLRPLVEAAQPLPLAVAEQASQAERLIADAVAAGARALLATGPVAENCLPASCRPCLILDAKSQMALGQEASFAPIAVMVPFDDVEEALRMNALCRYGLGAAIFSSDLARAERLACRLAVGVVTINDVIRPTAHPATPFGGRGQSGWGVTQGAEGLLEMTVPQVVSVSRGGLRPHYEWMTGQGEDGRDFFEGLLAWSHGATVGRRLRGFWRWLRGVRRIGSG